jgi:SOS-response transcriptional repressor LexA
MNKYQRLQLELETSGTGKMKCFGNSMLPILKSGSLLTFKKEKDYTENDIVFCKVKGRYIDAHKIIKVDARKGFLIANNHGYENGWTRTIYGKAIESEFNNERKTL